MEMEKKNTRYLLIALMLTVCAILSILCGAVAGGVAGYFAGRSAAQNRWPPRIEIRPSPEQRFHFEIPAPEMPERPFEWQPRTPGLEGGALVKEIIEGAPADDADLHEGDLITHVDGERITPFRELVTLVQKHAPGDRIELTVERDSTVMTIELTLGGQPDDRARPYVGIYYETVFSTGTEVPRSQD